MSFGSPLWLWGLLILPVLALLFVQAERRSVRRLRDFVAPRLLPQLAGTVNYFRRTCRFALQVLALALALVSLPSAIASHNPVTLVSWISQTFLQLVLLSVIIVGQNVLAAAADKRSEATYNDADAVLHEAVMIQEHLAAQDKVLGTLMDQAQATSG